MAKDPYASLARTFSGSGGRSAPPWVLGEVISTAPLVVEYGGVELDGEDLTVNAALLMDPVSVEPYLRDLLKGLILKPGDTVALLPNSTQQHFLLMAKVVESDG